MQKPNSNAPISSTSSAQKITPDIDLIGTSCPMAFVKARIFLDQKHPGETVTLLYEDTKANAPLARSIEGLGHIIQSSTTVASPSRDTMAPNQAENSPKRKLHAILLTVQVQI